MFARSLNRALLRIQIETVTPLLIRSGDTGLDPGGTDLKCVRTRFGAAGRTVYVPGSSLKGVIRSTAESRVRGRVFGDEVRGACDPLDSADSCASKTRSRSGGADVYSHHCLACRVFGSLTMKGRATARDLFPWSDVAIAAPEEMESFQIANRTQVRNGVTIDRTSGGAARNKLFEQEVVIPGARFWGEIALENYQVWQLGLVAAGLRDLEDGFAQLGSSKSRGLGVVKFRVESLIHQQLGSAATSPLGVGRLASAQAAKQYKLFPEGSLPETPGEGQLVRRFTAGGELANRWLDAGVAALDVLT